MAAFRTTVELESHKRDDSGLSTLDVDQCEFFSRWRSPSPGLHLMKVLKASLSSACREKETSTVHQEFSFSPLRTKKHQFLASNQLQIYMLASLGKNDHLVKVSSP